MNCPQCGSSSVTTHYVTVFLAAKGIFECRVCLICRWAWHVRVSEQVATGSGDRFPEEWEREYRRWAEKMARR